MVDVSTSNAKRLSCSAFLHVCRLFCLCCFVGLCYRL